MLKNLSKLSLKHTTIKLTATVVIITPLLLSGCTSISNAIYNNEDSTQNIKENERAYFLDAQKHIKNKRYTEAEKALEDLRIHYAAGIYSKQALLDLIYIRVEKGDYQQAVLTANNFLTNYPTHSQADYAWYAKGIANMKSNNSGLIKFTSLKSSHRDISFLRSAFTDFQNLIQRHPDSQYRADTIQRMYFIYNQIAEHEMNVARFNIKRKAYLGAVERAKTVFIGFPQSPQTAEAVAILAFGYDKLGLTEQANSYKKILQDNYPHLLVDNEVQIDKTHTSPSWVNRITLGLFGQASTINVKGSGFPKVSLNRVDKKSHNKMQAPVLPSSEMMDPNKEIVIEQPHNY